MVAYIILTFCAIEHWWVYVIHDLRWFYYQFYCTVQVAKLLSQMIIRFPFRATITKPCHQSFRSLPIGVSCVQCTLLRSAVSMTSNGVACISWQWNNSLSLVLWQLSILHVACLPNKITGCRLKVMLFIAAFYDLASAKLTSCKED